jgi:parallel beta-helix repeat protein
LIQKLNISDNEAYGISLVRSEHNVISENTVNNSQWAIRLWYSSIGNEIYGNFVTDSGYGILLHGPLCDQNRIFNNTAMGNYYGIHLGGETYMNVIERNVLTNNTIGLSMDANSMNIWRENMVEGNNVGLYAWATLNNYFYHNNFVGNRRGVSLKDARDFWDNGCEGNYWSDYNGTDLDNDGVGDTELPWLGVDYFPLVNPFWNAGDVNHDSRINGKDVAILCKAYGTEQGEPNWNPHADENSDLKIDGEDIAIVATYFNAHFP